MRTRQQTSRPISRSARIEAYGPVVDLAAETVAGTINVWVLELSLSVYWKTSDLPPMLGELLLVVSRDLLEGCMPVSKQQPAPRWRRLQRGEVHYLPAKWPFDVLPNHLASV